MIFDGKAFAKEIEARVQSRVAVMDKKPKIVSVLVGDDPASELYTNLKAKAAGRVGIEFEVAKIESKITNEELAEKIRQIGEREDVVGVMVQMPLLRQGFGGQAIPYSRDETEEIIRAIPLDKDVDGLRWEESGVVPATVRAIISILDKIAVLGIANKELWQSQFVVIGSHGSVGKPLMHFLHQKGLKDITEVNSDTKDVKSILTSKGEVMISCVGKVGLVTGEMVKVGAIVVDVGISKVNGKIVGDMTQEVYKLASVAVPVPGGVGPVTVASLMENAAQI